MIAALAVALAATVDWVALPIASYNSDDGFAGGAVARVQWLDGQRPYRALLAGQVLFSTAGVQSHHLRLDLPGLFGTRMRVRTGIEFHREVAAPYYGIGNDTSASLRDHPGLSPARAFEYERTYPRAFLVFTAPAGDSGLRLSLLVRYLWLSVHPYAGSLLARERPPGFEGGEELSVGAGVLLDRRDDRAVPTRGYLLEATVRGAAAGVAATYSFAGGTARALGFVPLGPRVVLATRVDGDLLTRGAPLFELSRFGGVDDIEGVGGVDSLRGIPKARYIGRAKLLAAAEARVRLFDASILGRLTSFGVAGFFDSGRVWELNGSARSFFDFHWGTGGGLRLSHRETVVRLDFATSPDRRFGAYFALGTSF